MTNYIPPSSAAHAHAASSSVHSTGFLFAFIIAFFFFFSSSFSFFSLSYSSARFSTQPQNFVFDKKGVITTINKVIKESAAFIIISVRVITSSFFSPQKYAFPPSPPNKSPCFTAYLAFFKHFCPYSCHFQQCFLPSASVPSASPEGSRLGSSEPCSPCISAGFQVLRHDWRSTSPSGSHPRRPITSSARVFIKQRYHLLAVVSVSPYRHMDPVI